MSAIRNLSAAGLFFVMFGFACASGFGQECTASVVVNVFDDKLRADVLTLKAEDFQARARGDRIPVINSVQDYDSRLLILLEVDRAEKDSKVRDIVDTVTLMAKQAPEGKPVAFGIYSDRAVFTKEFVTDPDKRKAQIGEVVEESDSLGKRVALYDALLQGLQMFGKPQPGDALLVVGSPYDDKSSHSITEVKNRFLSTGTRLMAMERNVMSHTDRDFMGNHDPEKSLFLDFTEETGGAHSRFDPQFVGFPWRGYLLDLKVPDRGKQQGWNLKVPGMAAAKHIKVFYPEFLPACRK